ncbi:hypothetical protein [Methylomonas sp. AM2-LC]|uniref:hypothetical protein n=1 Tax=Methylomonas sp. AM2-LC TaxID=3153301 RepID=UPI003267F77C
MNTLIYYSLEVLILSGLVLIVGLIKPNWIFLWMDKPGRMPVIWLATALFMIGMVLNGEGRKKLKLETPPAVQSEQVKPISEIPVPESTVVQPQTK